MAGSTDKEKTIGQKAPNSEIIKENDQIIEKEFTFNELYPDGEKLLIGFMKYLKVKPVEQAEEDVDEEAGDE